MSAYTLRLLFKNGADLALHLSDEWREDLDVASAMLRTRRRGMVRCYGLSVDTTQLVAVVFTDADGSPADPRTLYQNEGEQP